MTAVREDAAAANGVENRPPNPQVPWRENLNIHLICPDCRQDPPDLIEEDADTICNNCGRVLAERLISYESEWRTFNNDEKGGEDPNRVGDVENPLLYGNQGTTIGGGGANLSKETRKLKKAQAMQNEDKDNQHLLKAYGILDAWCEADNIPNNVRKRSHVLYKAVHAANVLRGKDLKTILVGCLFISTRECKNPRTFQDIVNLTQIPKKEVGRIFKSLNKFFLNENQELKDSLESENLTFSQEAMGFAVTGSSRPVDLVPRYCNMLGLRFRVQSIALNLAESVSDLPQLAGRSPLSTAAACIYFACQLLGVNKTLSEINTVTSVSEATIKSSYKNLVADKDRLVQQSWLGPQPNSIRESGPQLVGALENLSNS